jgi:galactose mutarotase-like enzyme
MQLLYHINLGEPLLEAGAKIIAPARTVAPRDAHAAEALEQWATFAPPKPGFAEQVYWLQLQPGDDGRTRVLLRNATGTRGVSISFSVDQLPYFVVWKNGVASQDGYVCGLEPAINFPNPRSFEERQGRVRKLLPGETLRFELQFEVHNDASSVEGVERTIHKLQQPLTTTLYRQPRAEWSR